MPDNYPALPDPTVHGALSPLDPPPVGFPQAYEEPEGGSWSVGRILAALNRYKWLVLLITLLGTAAGFAVASFMQPAYVARATLWMESTKDGQFRGGGPIRDPELFQSYAWVELLKSFAVLEPVVEELGLNVIPESPEDAKALSSLRLGETFKTGAYRFGVDESGKRFTLATADGAVIQRGRVGEPVGAPAGFQWLPPAAVLRPGSEIPFRITGTRDVAMQVSQRLSPRIAEDGNFLTIDLEGTQPEQLAATLNAIAEREVQLAAELKSASLKEKTEILSEQLQYSANSLREAESSLQQFRVQTATLPSGRATPVAPGLSITQDPVFSNYFDLKVQQQQLRRDRESLQQVLRQSRTQGSVPQAALEVIPSTGGSSELKQALGELTEKEAQLRAVRSRYTDENPAVKQLQGQVDVLEQQTVPRLTQNVISSLSQRENQLAGLISSAGQELGSIPPRAIEEARLERRAEIAASLYTNLRGRYEEARLAAASSIPDLRILDRAAVPRVPSQDDRPRIILMALLGSLGAGLLGAVLLDRFDPRLRYPEQVTDQLGLPILGVIPEAEGGERLNTAGAASMVEAFREARLNLVHAYGGAGPLVLTITSPGSGDGKSFVASHLALAFAELGHKTLLIDGDTRRGELHRLFQGSRKPGLMDHLAGNVSREQIIQSTAASTLDLIACGTRQQNGPELLGSGAMSELIAGLRSRYGVILIDSPPLGAGVDPFVLSTLTSNVLLVVRTGATKRDYAEAKFDLLARLPVRILGAVLNGATSDGAYRYYSYLSGYEAVDESEVVETRQLESV